MLNSTIGTVPFFLSCHLIIQRDLDFYTLLSVSGYNPDYKIDLGGASVPVYHLLIDHVYKTCFIISVLLHLSFPDPRSSSTKCFPSERNRHGEGVRQTDLVQRRQVAHRDCPHFRFVDPTPRRRL